MILHKIARFFLASQVLLFPVFCKSLMADDYLDMSLEDLLEVQITGSTLQDESLNTVPSSVTVFTRAQLDAMGVDYLYELISLVQGFQLTRGADTPVNYTYSSRGRRLGVRSREIILVVDGRALVDPRSSGSDSAVSMLPLNNIERIEIIHGPGSAIYGSGAFMGVINIISRKQNRINLAIGGEQNQFDLGYSASHGDLKLDLYAHAHQDTGQTYHLASQQTTNDPNSELLVDSSVTYKDTQLQIFLSEQSADNFYILEKLNNAFNKFQLSSLNINLNQAFSFSSIWQSQLSIGYTNVAQDIYAPLVQQSIPAGISENNPLLAKVLLSGEAYNASFAHEINASSKSHWQFGVDWKHEREVDAKARTNYSLSELVSRTFPITYYGNFDHSFEVGSESSRDIFSAYGQFIYQIFNDTRLTLGARQDYYQDIGKHISPRFGLVHQINDNNTVKFLYGEAFRAPSIAETGLLNNPLVLGNPNLHNETVKTVELLWLFNWKNVSINSAIYHNQFENPIANGLIGNIRTYVNAEDSSNYGGSIGLNWQVSSSWLMQIENGFMEDLPNSAFREADELSTLSLNYTKDKWNWNFAANYQGERQYQLTTTQKDSLESHWIANSRLRYQLQKNISLQLTVKNIFDEQYYSPSQGPGILNGIPHRRREWFLGAEWRY